MIGVWKAFLYDKTDSFIAELPFEGLSVETELNGIPKSSIRVNYMYLKRYIERQGNTVDNALSAGFRYVDLKRNNTTIFKGILNEPSIQKFDADINITLPFKGWLAYFSRRYITKAYTNTDAGQIAWDAIATLQDVPNGNIGIIKGVVDPTVPRDRSFKNDEAAKSIIHLSSTEIINGFEFEISNNKVLTVKTILGANKPYIVFDKSVIQSYQIDYMLGLSLTNKVILFGDGFGEAQLTSSRSSPNAYAQNWYLLEKQAAFSSVKELNTLNAHGDFILNQEQDAKKNISIAVSTRTIDLTEYDVGDMVKVEIENIINASYRIKSKKINVQQGEEVINLEFML